MTIRLLFLVIMFMIPLTKAYTAKNTTLNTGTNAGMYVITPRQVGLLRDGKMHIYLCGTGDPEVTLQEIRKPACIGVIAENQFLLVDAGEGSIQTLGAMGLPYDVISKIFMTHWHSDHFGGLGQVINASWVDGNMQPIDVYGPYGTKQVLSGLKRSYQLDMLFRLINRQGLLDPKPAFAVAHEFSATSSGDLVYATTNLKIFAFLVHHEPVYPAVGYRIQYKGCKVVISGDTTVVDSLRKNAQNADILINEALSHPLYAQAIAQAKASGNLRALAFAKENRDYHSDTWLLAKMAQQANVKQLVLTHLVPAIPTTNDAKAAFSAGMSQYYTNPIIVGDDQDEIVLQSKGPGSCQVEYHSAPQLPIKVQKIGG